MADSGFFDNISDAVSSIGGLLESPATASAQKMNNAAGALGWKYESVDTPDRLNFYTLQQAFGNETANEVWGTMLEVQIISDEFSECGAKATNAIKSATTDYIRNTGIQEAGRELHDRLKSTGNIADCVSGFATLFESKGIIDDAIGLGDLDGLMSNVTNIINNASNPSKLANIIANTAAVQEMIQPYVGFCEGMKSAMDVLSNADASALSASLNKLSQWAAFTKLATSDPCALVNNQKMLSHITSPVLDDIIGLYDSVTSGGLDGIAGVGISAPIDIGNLVPKLDAQSLVSSMPFSAYASSLPSELSSIRNSIPDITSVSPMSFVEGEWVENSSMNLKSDFTKNIVNGINMMDDSTALFTNSKGIVDYASIVDSKEFVEKVETTIDGSPIVASNFVDTSNAPITRNEAAEMTILKPDSGSGEDGVNVTKTSGKIKENFSVSSSAVPILEGAKPVPFDDASKVNYAFNREDVKKEVCKCILDGKMGGRDASSGLWFYYPNIIDNGQGLNDNDLLEQAWSKLRTEVWKMKRKITAHENSDVPNTTTIAALTVEYNILLSSRDEAEQAYTVAQSDNTTSKTYKMLYDKENMNSGYCSTLGGTWKCTKDLRGLPAVSADTFNQTKNVELKNSLPSKSQYMGKIGG